MTIELPNFLEFNKTKINDNIFSIVNSDFSHIYQGDMNCQKCNGYGKYWTIEFNYHGNWKDNKFHGKGYYTYIGNTTDTLDNFIISYDGEWCNGIKQGYGIIKYKNGESYYGYFHDDHKHGEGKYYNKNGSLKCNNKWYNDKPIENEIITEYYDNSNLKYTGYFNDEGWYGKGKEYFRNNELHIKYNGNFDQGEYNGYGELYYENNNLKYKGYFLSNKYHGIGELYHDNNNLHYRGEFRNGKIIGGGKIYDKNCNIVYDGEVYNWLEEPPNTTPYANQLVIYHGKGIIYKNSNFNNFKYKEGNFLYGKLIGECNIYHNNCKLQYKGELLNDLRHGEGKLYFQSGKLEFNGLFQNDKFLKGKQYWDVPLQSSQDSELKFNGEYNLQGQYTGNGKLYYNNPNNSIEYNGIFQYGRFNGQGTLYYQNEHIDYQGTWINGKRSGNGTSHYESTGNIEYFGEWLTDERHGIGTLYDESGMGIFSGNFTYNEIAPNNESMANAPSAASIIISTTNQNVNANLLENVDTIYGPINNIPVLENNNIQSEEMEDVD